MTQIASEPAPAPDPDLDPAPHSIYEDAFALLTGALFIALGLMLFRQADIGTGGTTGIALLVHYATGYNLGVVFFIINLPFYVFAYLRMGLAFTLKTFAAVALLSLISYGLPRLITIATVDALFAAVAGGLLIGVGLLVLIRHKASLGGVGVLAFYLQDRIGWRAGKVQLALDAVILTGTLFVLTPAHVVLSVVGAVVLNVVLWANHRQDRYIGY